MVYVSNTSGKEAQEFYGESFGELFRIAEGIAKRGTGYAYIQNPETHKVLAIVCLQDGYGTPVVE